MVLTLRKADFTNDKLLVQYGNREALFTIVNETFTHAGATCAVNNIAVLVRELSPAGEVTFSALQSAIIGLGNAIIGVRSDNRALRGKVLSEDNMEECSVILYEVGEA